MTRSSRVFLMIGLSAVLTAAPSALAAAPGCGDRIPCLTADDCPRTLSTVEYKCVDEPMDDCDPRAGDRDCAQICVQPLPDFCGGFPLFPCPEGTVCVETATQGYSDGACAYDCGGRDCGGECALFEGRARPCHGRIAIHCPGGMTCLDNMFDDCHAACGGERCAGECGRVAPDDCQLGRRNSCPRGMLCVVFDDFSPYPQPPGEPVVQCGLLPNLDCEAAADCPGGYTCADDPDDNCDPATANRDCPTCCVPR